MSIIRDRMANLHLHNSRASSDHFCVVLEMKEFSVLPTLHVPKFMDMSSRSNIGSQVSSGNAYKSS